jgi:hypothetical protein
MKKTGKQIAVFFVWLAILVLLGHGFVPHHHHSNPIDCAETCDFDEVSSLANHQLNHGHSFLSHCKASHNNANDPACHFKTEATTEFSKQAVQSFVLVCNWLQLVRPTKDTNSFYESWSNHYSFDFFNYKTSRGPPAIV